jgi:anti-sigma B factor antagonist
MLKVNARNLGNVAFLSMQGQIVNGETEALRKAVHFQSEAQSDVSTVVLDLSQVSIVDAGGLGVMLQLREQVQSKGISFKLMNVSKLVGRVLEITRLDSVFEVTSGVEFFPAASRRQPAPVMHLASCA